MFFYLPIHSIITFFSIFFNFFSRHSFRYCSCSRSSRSFSHPAARQSVHASRRNTAKIPARQTIPIFSDRLSCSDSAKKQRISLLLYPERRRFIPFSEQKDKAARFPFHRDSGGSILLKIKIHIHVTLRQSLFQYHGGNIYCQSQPSQQPYMHSHVPLSGYRQVLSRRGHGLRLSRSRRL